MFKIPEIDMDFYGQTEAELYELYQMTLGALPPGTKSQLTVFEVPFDLSDGISCFTEQSSDTVITHTLVSFASVSGMIFLILIFLGKNHTSSFDI